MKEIEFTRKEIKVNTPEIFKVAHLSEHPLFYFTCGCVIFFRTFEFCNQRTFRLSFELDKKLVICVKKKD